MNSIIRTLIPALLGSFTMAACGSSAPGDPSGNPPEPACETLGNCPEPNCEELGNCPEPTCEELGNCPIPDDQLTGRCRPSEDVPEGVAPALRCEDGSIIPIAFEQNHPEDRCLYERSSETLLCTPYTVNLREPCTERWPLLASYSQKAGLLAFAASGCDTLSGDLWSIEPELTKLVAPALQRLKSVYGGMHITVSEGIPVDLFAELDEVMGNAVLTMDSAGAEVSFPKLRSLGGRLSIGTAESSSSNPAIVRVPEVTNVNGLTIEGTRTNPSYVYLDAPLLWEIREDVTLTYFSLDPRGWDGSELEFVGARLMVDNNLSDLAFTGLTRVGRYLKLSNISGEAVSFDALKSVGRLAIENHHTEISFPALSLISGSLVISELSADKLDFQALRFVRDNVSIRSQTNAEVYVRLPVLADVGGEFMLHARAAHWDTTIARLVMAHGEIDIQLEGNFPSMKFVSAPSVRFHTNQSSFGAPTSLMYVSGPVTLSGSLEKAYFYFLSAERFVTWNGPKLNELYLGFLDLGELGIVQNPKLQKLAMSSLFTMRQGAIFNVYGNSLLPQARVDEILSRLAIVPTGASSPNGP